MDDLLYDIGLSLTSTIDVPNKRTLIHNPFFIFSFSCLFLVQKLLSLFLTKKTYLLVICGDVAFYYGTDIKLVINIAVCLCVTIIISSQLIYFFNHKVGTKPTFLKVFRMIENVSEHEENGLIKIEQVQSLSKLTRRLVMVAKLNGKLVYPAILCYHLTPLYFNGKTLWKVLLYGIPPSLMFYMEALIFLDIEGIQIIYFYIHCKYLKLKLKNLTESVEQIKRGIGFLRVGKVVQQLVSLLNEIDEYNTSYWSKFLFCNWLTFGMAVVNFIAALALLDLPMLLNILVFYTIILLLSLFLVIVLSAASVNHWSNKCYQLFNSLFIWRMKTRIVGKTRIGLKIKV